MASVKVALGWKLGGVRCPIIKSVSVSNKIARLAYHVIWSGRKFGPVIGQITGFSLISVSMRSPYSSYSLQKISQLRGCCHQLVFEPESKTFFEPDNTQSTNFFFRAKYIQSQSGSKPPIPLIGQSKLTLK